MYRSRQIPGSTGGDIVAKHPMPAFDDPFFFPTDGIVLLEYASAPAGGAVRRDA
jgi:hypothetical protein